MTPKGHVFTFMILMLFLVSGSIVAQPVNLHGQLKVVGTQLLNKNNNPIILRGQGHGWHIWWPQYWNANVVKWLVDDWKCQILRPAMGIEPAGGYLSDRKRSTSLTETVVDAAIKNGVYVIIDWHAHGIHENEAVEFFTNMAKKYGKYPNVLYEIVNEPDNKVSWDQVKTYSNAVIKAIRQHDPDNIVIVGCPHWDQDIDKVADSPLTGFTNIMYSVHFYAATHGKWLRDKCDYALGKNIPIIVSECNGAEASGSGRIDYTEWKTWIDYMDKKMISWLNWSVSDKPGEACSILKPGTSSNGGWKESDLTETGAYTRKLLRSYPATPIRKPALQPAHRPITTRLNNGKINVQFTLPDPQQAAINLFTMNGSLLWNRTMSTKGAGRYSESINMDNLPNGIYLLTSKFGNNAHCNQVVLMR